MATRSYSLSAFCVALVCFWLNPLAAPARTTKRATAATASADDAGVHVVGPKDTLFGLARQYGTTVEKIQAANRLRSTVLRDGQRLRIPGAGGAAEPSAEAPAGSEDENDIAMEPEPGPQPAAAAPANRESTFHVVQKGDTLFGIAKKYGVTVSALKKANGIHGDTISRGQKLRVSGPGSGEEEPAAGAGAGEGALKKIGRAIKNGVNDLVGGEEEQPTETREIIPAAASAEKRNGKDKPVQKEVDDNLATYLVTPYDSLEKIALDFNTTSAKLMELNQLASAGDLRTKKQIYVPGNGLSAKWGKPY